MATIINRDGASEPSSPQYFGSSRRSYPRSRPSRELFPERGGGWFYTEVKLTSRNVYIHRFFQQTQLGTPWKIHMLNPKTWRFQIRWFSFCILRDFLGSRSSFFRVYSSGKHHIYLSLPVWWQMWSDVILYFCLEATRKDMVKNNNKKKMIITWNLIRQEKDKR